MSNNAYTFHYCSRMGCGREMGVQRIVDGKVIEEEFHSYAIKDGDKYYCEDCINKKDTFKDPWEDAI